MFGMSDPAQTLLQMRRYADEGRLEMAEVMAREFTEMMLARRGRDPSDERRLVEALALLVGIYSSRGKSKEAMSTYKVLKRHRSKMHNMEDTPGPQRIQERSSDLALLIEAAAHAGAWHPAKRALRRQRRLGRGMIAGIGSFATHGAPARTLKAIRKHVMTALDDAGPIIHKEGTMSLIPEGEDPVPILPILEWIGVTGVDDGGRVARYREEIRAIEAGEAASDARLAAAIASLTPSMDYHEYSGSR